MRNPNTQLDAKFLHLVENVPAARGTGLCHLERSGVPCKCCAPKNTVNQGKVPAARSEIVRFQALTLVVHPEMGQVNTDGTQCHVVSVAIHSSSQAHVLGCGFSKKQTKKKPRSSAQSVFDLQCVCGVQKKRSNRHSIRALDCAPQPSQWFCSVRK